MATAAGSHRIELEKRTFDTALFATRDRLDAACAFFDGAFDVRTLPNARGAFRSRNAYWRLGACVAGKALRQAAYFTARDQFVTSNYLVARLVIAGHYTAIRNGSVYCLEPGQIGFGPYVHNAVGFTGSRAEFWSLSAPTDEVGMDERAVRGFRTLSVDTPNGRVLHALMLSVFESLNDARPHDATLLSETVIALFRLLVNGFQRADDASRAVFVAARAQAMRRYVDAHLGVSDLGPAQIAAAFGVSRAAVFRAFQDEGGVAQTIVRRRMARAFGALATSDGTRGAVQAVAFASGYDDPAHFSRVFRRQLGVPPRDVIGLAANTSSTVSPARPMGQCSSNHEPALVDVYR